MLLDHVHGECVKHFCVPHRATKSSVEKQNVSILVQVESNRPHHWLVPDRGAKRSQAIGSMMVVYAEHIFLI